MKTKTLGMLMFSGVAAGVALSAAIVFATSSTEVVKPQSTAKADRLVVQTDVQPSLTTKADRLAISPDVVRSTKTDALDITLAILRGSDIDTADEPVEPIAAVPDTLIPETPVEPLAESVEDVVVTPRDSTARLEATPRPVRTAPVVQDAEPVATGDPVSIVPSAEPVENTPASAPTTTTNFTISAPDRSDLLR